MSALPEWLWPLEDEKAVQEAERLIEETHNTLQRMEADMHVQRISGQHLSQQTEKLKSAVNNKIHFLEKELKNLSEPTISTTQLQQHHSSDSDKLKLATKGTERCGKQQQVNLSESHLETCPKSYAFSGSHLSLNKQGRSVNSKKKTSAAEKVVLTARAKVEDALTVARNVSASLGQHMSVPSLHSKPVSCSQVNNIGIFEVKSQADEKQEQIPKRLGRTLLPSISIKRGLEKQSIPSIAVAPGEKLVAANVSLFNMKYDNEVNSQQSVDLKDKNSPGNLQYSSVEHQLKNACSPTNTRLEGAFAQLSKQLADVEELREVNQAQVNHVLKFLISRVCVTTPPPEKSNTSAVSQDKECKLQSEEAPPTADSPSTSESSHYPIVYDSLSRFLETYKQAAEQSMLARKRAAVRRQKVTIQQKKEILKTQSSTENNLLIGPLRLTTKLKEAVSQKEVPEVQDSMESFSTSSSLHQVHFSGNESNANSITEVSNDNDAEKGSADGEKITMDSPLESPVLFPLKPPGTVSAEEYEDDWEEEENFNGSVKQDELKINSTESFLIPIIEAEENLSSSSQSEKQKSEILPHSPDVEKKIEVLNTNPIKSLHMATPPEEKSSERQVKQFTLPVPTIRNGEGDTVDLSRHLNKNEDLLKCRNDSGKKLPGGVIRLHKGASSPGSESIQDSDEQIGKSSHGKTTYGIQIQKGKLHQTQRRRTQARFLHQDSSSSEAEMRNDLKPSLRNSKQLNLNLREDLQLQSAILLNWQMEERLKNKNNETFPVQNQTVPHVQQCEIPADVEKHWQKTLDQFDLRLKSIEENERIHRIASEIRLQSRQEPPRTSISEEVKKVSRSVQIEVPNLVSTKDQMVQTSPEKCQLSLPIKNSGQFLVSTKDQQKKPRAPQDYEVINSFGPPKPFLCGDDLTAELLTYSRMGILPRLGFREHSCSKSSSSSTASSHLQHSSIMVSLSDGELRDSASGSCSCSEGEFCVCGGRKLCSERAPPDGSQTSEGENFMKDVSQGEIPLNKVREILKDTSFGEVADYIQTGILKEDSHQAEEESLDSDVIEWELRS